MAILEENLSMLEETYEGTDLHLASKLGYEVHAKSMIELRNALISSINSKGDTPLHLAASLGHTSILIWMLESIELHNACETKALEVPKLSEMRNNDGLTPLHCAAMNGSVEILRVFLDKFPSSFYSVTLEKKETVFHVAARHKKDEAFIFMAKSDKLGQLLYQLDVEGNTVLHAAASVGSIDLVKYIIKETEVKVTTKNKKGFVAVDLLNKDDGDFLQLFTALMMCDLEIVIERPPSPREMGNFDSQEVDDLKLQKEIVRVKSSPNKKFEMQLEALQSARNTLTIVAVLIASVTFTCGINPPGGVYQETSSIGKSTAARTLAYMIFTISNSIALFTSVSMVVLLVSIIPYKQESLLKFLIIAHRMMWVAVGAMASAYVSATSVILPNFGETKWLLYATLAIASLTLGVMFVYLHCKLAKCHKRKVHLLGRLTTPPVRNRYVDMAANIEKGYYSLS
ncbi:hypothetical protein EUTSA_v10015398mg [Eutrema salsugineum]|uniref:PGG domain-containing protein n=1 Tax=Eutrema salsugineum TaxID=72664 RepID=V4KYH4_EUTSA|nr:ankyrin repeat-containing protein NPR4 [Eutrema salsugineum]ESQ42995.1 hypothetical protein EUTSA_v10015398mg [Eutrema salsugineum]